MSGAIAVPSPTTAAGTRTWAPRTPARSRPAQLPFHALMLFTFIVVVAPQAVFPVLAPFHLALVTAAVAAIAHAADRLRRGQPLTVMEAEMRLILLFFALVVLSIPTSYWPSGSVAILVDLLAKSVCVFFLLANILVTGGRLRAMFALLTVCSMVPAVAVLRNYLTGELVRDRVQGYVSVVASNPNDVALILNIVIPLAVGLMLTTASRSQRAGLAAAIALAAVSVVVTFSRAGFIYLATTLVLYLGRLKRGRLGIVLLMLLLAGLALSLDGFLTRIGTITDTEREASAHERWETMKDAVVLIAHRPLLGVGLGQSVIAMNDLGVARWRFVHNMYLEVGADVGIPALIVYVVLLGQAVRSVSSAKRRWRARRVPLHHLAQGLEVSLIGFAVAAMFYPIAYHLFFYYLVGMAVAVKVLCRRDSTERARLAPAGAAIGNRRVPA